MSHFASTNWNNPTGLVASLSKAANAVRTTTGVTATEGTNQLTYTTVRAGLYRVSAYLRVSTASDANTSHTLASFASYNNGTAITGATIGTSGVTPGTANAKGTAGTTVLHQNATVYCANATNIVMYVTETISGTPTAGAYDIHFTIEAV